MITLENDLYNRNLLSVKYQNQVTFLFLVAFNFFKKTIF